MLDTRRLRTFVAVAEELGFGRAGARLGLAQPAVSKHIKDLEAAVGGQLFERRAGGVRLTAAGLLLLHDARSVLNSLNATAERVQRLARGETGTLTVGYNETVSWHTVIPRAVRRFRELNPAVQLTLVPMLSIDQLDALQSHQIDAGFMFRWDDMPSGLASRPVLSTPIRLAVPDSTRWAEQPPSSLGELAGAPFILFPRRAAPAYYDHIMATCAAAGLKPNVVQEVYNESAALSLVAVGMGLTFGPESARHRCPAAVKLVAPADLDLSATLDLVWREPESGSPLVARLIAATAEVAEDKEREDAPVAPQ